MTTVVFVPQLNLYPTYTLRILTQRLLHILQILMKLIWDSYQVIK
jgi:hypothetical protein